MRIALDNGLISNTQHAVRGVGNYTSNLYKALTQLSVEKNNFEISLVDLHNSKVLNGKYDLVHYPFFDFFFHTLPLSKKLPTVVTVHDTVPLIYPEHYPPGIKGGIRLKLQTAALSRADAVITVSETSKRDITRFLGISGNKITVAYNGPTLSPQSFTKTNLDTVKNKYNLPKKYLLYVGDVNWNKNLNSLCEAAIKINTSLVVVGKMAINSEYDKSHIENKPLLEFQEKYSKHENIISVGYVDDEELSMLYQLSFCYCQPSWYEGFGLGVLNAMALGTPTIISKTQSLVELFGDASLTFEPANINQLCSAIQRLSSKNVRSMQINKGVQLAKNYTWARAAKNIYETYLQVLSK